MESAIIKPPSSSSHPSNSLALENYTGSTGENFSVDPDNFYLLYGPKSDCRDAPAPKQKIMIFTVSDDRVYVRLPTACSTAAALEVSLQTSIFCARAGSKFLALTVNFLSEQTQNEQIYRI